MEIDPRKLASIEYHGQAGITRDCLNALVRLIHFGDSIENAQLLTCKGTHSASHCFLLTINQHDLVAIKSGFSSGYYGEGPSGMSSAIKLLLRQNVEIYEYLVTEDVISRCDHSSLLNSDLEDLENTRPVLPHRFYGYRQGEPGSDINDDKYLKQLFPITLPLGLLDARIVDLALEFGEYPDHAVMKAYKRLEDTIRKKTGLNGSGAKLFAKAFQGDNSILFWKNIEATESIGRANLFIGAFMAFRNPRAHKEQQEDREQATREFLILNELYLLESQSITRPAIDSPKNSAEQLVT